MEGAAVLQGHDTGVHQLLQAHEDAQLGVIPGEAALEVDGVRVADGAVGGELDGAALHEGAGGHDDLRARPAPLGPQARGIA